MAKLTDTQHLILTAATARPDRLALPLPEHIKGGAAKKVVTALITLGLVEEVPAESGAPVWREGDDGGALTLTATDAAFRALGVSHPPKSMLRTPQPPRSCGCAPERSRPR